LDLDRKSKKSNIKQQNGTTRSIELPTTNDSKP